MNVVCIGVQGLYDLQVLRYVYSLCAGVRPQNLCSGVNPVGTHMLPDTSFFVLSVSILSGMF